MPKFTPPDECNTHFPNYLDGGMGNIVFSGLSFSQYTIRTPNRLQLLHPLSKKSKKGQQNTQNTHFWDVDYTKRSETNYSQQRKWFTANLSLICESLLGQKVIDITFLGGKYRNICRLSFANGNSVIATRRQEHNRTLLEQQVLTTLAPFTNRLPKAKAFNGLVLLQEDLLGTRLSEAIKAAPEERYETLTTEALESLFEIHQAADQAGLDHAVPLLGCDNRWLNGFIDQLDIIGRYLEIPCPVIPRNEIIDLLTIMQPRFIKWDARPANAMVDNNGKIAWFDWEHCCARNRLDDVAWLLCDEIMPYHPNAETRLIKNYLAYFSDGNTLNQAHAYLRVFGILHMSVRLGGILSEKGNKPWMRVGNREYNLAEDPLLQAQRLCARAADWVKNSIYPNTMHDWFLAISARLKNM